MPSLTAVEKSLEKVGTIGTVDDAHSVYTKSELFVPLASTPMLATCVPPEAISTTQAVDDSGL